MNPRRQALKVDMIVFVACVLMATWYFGFEIGRRYQPKTCAEVKGLRPISSTADTCTYVQARGLAYYRRNAI